MGKRIAAIVSAGLVAFMISSAQAYADLAQATSEVISHSVCPKPKPNQATCFAKVLINKHTKQHVQIYHSEPGSNAPEEGTPAYLQQAYDLTYLSAHSGYGDTVAVVDFYWDAEAAADLTHYRQYYHLPPCTKTNGCFRQVSQTGGETPTPAAASCVRTEENDCFVAETSLDLDAVSAICPHCHILLVETNSPYYNDIIVAEKEAATLGAKQISNSFGVLSAEAPDEELSSGFSFPGVATVVSSGDTLYQGAMNSYPASLTSVTAVGGTTLGSTSEAEETNEKKINVRGWNEKVWNDSIFGGTVSGCNSFFSKPVWQEDNGCKGRAYNDISADGDPNTGLKVYDPEKETAETKGWSVAGGTSLAAPIVAAYYALVGHNAGVGGAAWDYAHKSFLHQISRGNDIGPNFGSAAPSCAEEILYICAAGNGYNGPSGNGSISGDVLPASPGIGGPSDDGSYTVEETSDSVSLLAGIYPNQLATKYWWEYGTSFHYDHKTKARFLTSKPKSGSGGIVSVSETIGCLRPKTRYYYRLVAQNRLGTSYGYRFRFSTEKGSFRCSSRHF